jgi:surfeit locus 1 family protein
VRQISAGRWIFLTALVIVAAGLFVRLGFWQLARLNQRQAFNARVQAQVNSPALELNLAATGADLYNMEYRPALATGEYDFAHQVALRNQAWNQQPGAALLTPLRIAGTERYVLVNRGWIPEADARSGDWAKYDQPGVVTVQGVIRRSESKPDFGWRADPILAPGEPPLKTWNFANLDAIGAQSGLKLLPVYIQQGPDAARSDPPHGSTPTLDLSEGPHLGYAIQWFSFAVIAVVGYGILITRKEAKRNHPGDLKTGSKAA